MNQTRFIIGVIIILFGLNFLFNLDLIRLIIAGVIIWIGIRMLVGEKTHHVYLDRTESSEDRINRVLVFSGMNQKVNSNDFKGAEVVVVFGGGELDLSEVKTKQSAVNLEFVAIFGGLKITLPQSWQVSSEGVGILGGFDNKTAGSGKKTTQAKVKGVAILGGVEIVS